jgi:hypothetical protein
MDDDDLGWLSLPNTPSYSWESDPIDYESLFPADPRYEDTGYGFDDVNLNSGEGNLPPDYTVTQNGLIQDGAGNLGKFQNNQWVPYKGGDVNTFLGKSASGQASRSLLDRAKNFANKAGDFATSNQGIMAILAAIAAAADRQKPRGGGTTQAYAGPKPVTRTMTQGKYGPIARYAANGGLMQAYAQGGQVQMEDGGFVMTKKAVDGAGGPRGLASLVPGAKMIGGPPDPTGRKDLTPAVIHGPNGQTPAKVSRGEAYVPKRVVDNNGGSQEMYALMNSLQRRA